MYAFHPSLPPYDVELSRRAAARYAALTAVKERRSRLRDALRDPRPLSSWPRKLGISASASSPRC
jgi:hypothetical protein